MDLAPVDKPQKTTWMQFKGHPPPPKKPCIMHNERPIEQNQAATNKARGGQSKLIPRKEGSLQKVAQTRSKECNHKEEDIWKPWTSFTSNKQGENLPTSAKAGHYCQCLRTDTEIGRGSVSGKQQRQQKMGAVTGKTEAVTGKWATQILLFIFSAPIL